MKVLLISAYPPSRHNLGGPSALPYYLSKHRPVDIELDLYYYNNFGSKEHLFNKELQAVFNQIKVIPQTPTWKYYPLRILRELSLLPLLAGVPLKLLPPKEIVTAIKKEKYDLIWIYPNILFQWHYDLRNNKTVMTGPDNSFLNYTLIKEKYIHKNIFLKGIPQLERFNQLFKNSQKLENKWASSGALLHVVGDDDKKMYDKMGAGGHSFFSLHPYYEYESIKKPIADKEGRITILFTGTNESIYTGRYLEEIIGMISANPELAASYDFLFIGKNFENGATKLKSAGFHTSVHAWVDNYESAISHAQIQVFPIVLGTGTKGKVLCALATGLLCIGTKHAFENIQIDLREDCIYVPDNEPKQVIMALYAIINDKQMYTRIAKSASDKVRELHSPVRTSTLFWNKVKQYWKL